jgi:hypothetical protein
MPAVAEKPSKTSPQAALASNGGEAPASAGETFTDRLAALRHTADEAVARAKDAQTAMRRDGGKAAEEIARDLVRFRDDIEARKPSATPEADRPQRELDLTANYLDAVRQRGLVLMPVGEAGREVQVVDPSLARAYDAAFAKQLAASRAVQEFEKEHATDLAREAKAADAASIRDALAGEDGDAIREALSPSSGDGSGAFTTRDLPGVGRVHRRRV